MFTTLVVVALVVVAAESSPALLEEPEVKVPPKYTYEYAVSAAEFGNNFGHFESRDGPFTQGQYSVDLPDGRAQIVKYTVDENGYQADVAFEGEVTVQGPPAPSHLPKPLLQQSAPPLPLEPHHFTSSSSSSSSQSQSQSQSQSEFSSQTQAVNAPQDAVFLSFQPDPSPPQFASFNSQPQFSTAPASSRGQTTSFFPIRSGNF